MKNAQRPVVIGFYSPVPQSGKSTAARVLSAFFSLERLKISGAMKAMNAALLREAGIPEVDIPRYLDGDLKETPIPGLTRDDGTAITSRDVQKTLGLEWGRTLFGPNFWARPLHARISASTASVILIDDIRFPPDFDLVRAHGGINVRIVRPTGGLDTDGHQSEGLLEGHAFDLVLHNDSDITAFEALVTRQLVEMTRARLDAAATPLDAAC